ncbi:MAG: penicillin-binding transpeptidase domain-containing protein [Ignavibacteria bacterium]
MKTFEYTKNVNHANPSRRITFFTCVFTALLLCIYIKLFNIQVLNSARYQLAAKKQYESKISLKPTRGIIFDRKLNALVSNVTQFSFAADPNMVDNKDSVAEIFSSVFEKDKSYYLDKLNTNNTSFVWLERRVDQEYGEKLQGLNLSGVIKINESHRLFNYNTLASQIIGFTDIDNEGLSGTELECDEQLAGKDGYVVMQKDGLGRKKPAVEYPRMEPQNGNNIVLTIDMDVQKIIEEELENGINANSAEGGKCVVMSVKTGEILGMYSFLNRSVSEDAKDTYAGKLTFLTDLYEPGSTFKIVSAAASLEEGLENKNDIINTQGGEYQIGGIEVKDSHKFTSMSFQQVVEQSSNIGMMQVASKLGAARFYKYARDFGFGITTGVDLPGEVKGSLKRPVEFSPVSLSFMAIGYEVMVTAIQMANAYSCIANDGCLMKPYIIKKETTPDGVVIKEHLPTLIRKVISKNTARTLTDLLYGVVERGTGVEAKVSNMKVAGKTGTAQKLVNGEYSKKSYTSSFIGYFPAEDPQIVIAVIVDAPATGEFYGGKVAAPIFRRITERIISFNGLMDYLHPELQNTDSEIKIADSREGKEEPYNPLSINLVDFEVSDAVKLLKDNKIDYDIDGPKKNAVVVDQKIINEANGSKIKKITLITGSSSITASGKPEKDNPVIMPDLRGLSLRKCIKLLSSMGVDFKVNGTGRVAGYKPDAGTVLKANQQVIINCESNN